MTAIPKPTKSERIEIRATPEERALIDRAVATAGTDLTRFVISSLTVAATRVLADQTVFHLDAESQVAWERMNEQPARDLAGLRSLMRRPSPFIDE